MRVFKKKNEIMKIKLNIKFLKDGCPIKIRWKKKTWCQEIRMQDAKRVDVHKRLQVGRFLAFEGGWRWDRRPGLEPQVWGGEGGPR